MAEKKVIMSGMRPTGQLHLGNLMVLQKWVEMQEEYSCFFSIVDWHALTTSYDQVGEIPENVHQIAIDYLSAGLDPNRSVIFRQSDVKEHAELHLLFSMFTPLSWLERVPTYKDQIEQLQGKDLATYGFLGYPLLQAADILIYRANAVPVGVDQAPHIELTREVARRFNHLYEPVFPEPQTLFPQVKALSGLDNRKMSKSYQNYIAIADYPPEIEKKVRQMITDPARIHKTDPGHPDVCAVYGYQTVFNPGFIDLEERCRGGKLGCVQCKQMLTESMINYLAPVHERRRELEENPSYVEKVLAEGAEKARIKARETIKLVRQAMGVK